MTKKSFNPVGQRFGRLFVTSEMPRKISPSGISLRVWECRCECGQATRVTTSQICGKRPSRSCGCLTADKTIERNTKHGLAGKDRPPEYEVWRAMRRRCGNARCEDYPNYGGRGISVCERWNDFIIFYADMGSRPTPSYSIDRIDVNGNYEPSNCRWATPKEQRANQRRAA
jgi:hypothetical protein